MRIGLFDSGLGGLTVLKSLIKKYPNNEYIYYGDTLNVPYGNKTKEELEYLASQDIEFLIEKNVELIIIACGTVSSTCLEALKKKYDVPIIDILSPTIEYLNKSQFKTVGVIATHNTINSHIFKNKVSKNVIEVETPKLVNMIENNNLDNINEVLKDYLKNMSNIDALVLGCTHYPIIKRYLEAILPKVTIIDMSNNLIIPTREGKRSLQLYFSKVDELIKKNTKKILEIDNITILRREV